MTRILLFMFFILSALTVKQSYCATETIPFDSDKWVFVDAEKTEFLGRPCLQGFAYLKDTDFENGVIEFDMAVTGARAYPGILFRMKSLKEYERIYIRPHLSKVFQNVIQYEGTFNGLDSWQLYYGPGKSSSADIPQNKWFHVKIEVMNDKALLYLNNQPQPAMFITELAQGISRGMLAVHGSKDGSAYFSNFTYEKRSDITMPDTEPQDLPLGMITDWELSKPYKYNQADPEELPEKQGITDLNWQKIKSLPNGLVDVSRYYGRLGQTPDIIWAKTIITADKAETKQYAFGYSDIISIFLNGKLLFTGNSSYTSRDGNFQGIVGLNDYILLPLEKGKNELVVAVTESFGGWGFMFQDVDAVYQHPDMTKKWEIKGKMAYPESAVYDAKRDVFYVSNITYENGGFISKIKPDGTIEQLEWIKGILQPTGVTIYNDKLYIVGRYNLIEADIESGSITNRYPFPSPVFANDIAAADDGKFYITDGAKKAIFVFENGKISDWLVSPELARVNGIITEGGKVIVGTTADGCLKSIDMKTKEITKIASFGAGAEIDGLTKDGKGNYLISDHAGKVIRVAKDGKSELLLNTKARPITIADFEYVPAKKLLLIPTLADNRIMVYELK